MLTVKGNIVVLFHCSNSINSPLIDHVSCSQRSTTLVIVNKCFPQSTKLPKQFLQVKRIIFHIHMLRIINVVVVMSVKQLFYLSANRPCMCDTRSRDCWSNTHKCTISSKLSHQKPTFSILKTIMLLDNNNWRCHHIINYYPIKFLILVWIN